MKKLGIFSKEKPEAVYGKGYFSKDLETIYKELQTDPNQGLKQKENDSRYIYYGSNEIPKAGKSLFKIYLAPIFNIFILILIVSATILFFLREFTTALFTFLIILS